jgi:hypothetical protein
MCSPPTMGIAAISPAGRGRRKSCAFLSNEGWQPRIAVAWGPSLGFAVLKDLLRLLWPFIYSLSPPLFLLAPALELCTLACELAAYVR